MEGLFVNTTLLKMAKQATTAKTAFVPGGDPAMAGGTDPSMGGGAGMPMDPAMMAGGGMPMDPAMMAGGGPSMDPAMMGMPPGPPAAPPAGGGGLDEAAIRRIIQEEMGAGGAPGGEAKPKAGGKAKLEEMLMSELRPMKQMLAKMMDAIGLQVSATEAFGSGEEEEAAPDATGPAGDQGPPGGEEAPGPAGNLPPIEPLAAGMKSGSLLDELSSDAYAVKVLLGQQ